MITKEVISAIYKKFSKAPKSPDLLDMPVLFEFAGEMHDINVDFDTDHLVIGSVGADSPFHSLPLDRIHAIVPFDEWVGIVMPAAIIFLNKLSPKVSVHLKPDDTSFMGRLRAAMNL